MKYIILGGGTAGWLTALYLNKHFPNDEVTVVVSSEIGILGAGEGTTPAFMEYLEEVGITELELVSNCKATLKTGIKFTNWNGDGEHYFHNFWDNKYALHFDASLLAKYLQDVAVSRGVKLIDDTVIKVLSDNGNITTLVTPSGLIAGDFFFDCSGFKRLLIGEVYNSEWEEYDMPCKRAIPFFLPNDGKNFPDYTESVAMKYGWIWKIPVQGRYGCGYVFDSTMTTDEEAAQEIRDYLGHDFMSPKTFNFSAGAYKQVWINNCMAVGLSSGFIEPLEATSIWIQILALRLFVENRNNPEKVNNDVKELNEDILAFLYFHYLSQRTDTGFWRDFQTNNYIPEKLLNRIKGNGVQYSFNLFPDKSWDSIASGIRYPK
jgi:tryptophan halogenase